MNSTETAGPCFVADDYAILMATYMAQLHMSCNFHTGLAPAASKSGRGYTDKRDLLYEIGVVHAKFVEGS